jgi:PIN domain nuclease of toxin-antitoxin system
MVSAGAKIVPVSDEHVIRAGPLEILHSDPFDRLLLAIAVVEQMTLLTAAARLHELNAIGSIKAV